MLVMGATNDGSGSGAARRRVQGGLSALACRYSGDQRMRRIAPKRTSGKLDTKLARLAYSFSGMPGVWDSSSEHCWHTTERKPMLGHDAKAIVRRFFDEAWNQKKAHQLDEYISAVNIHRGLSADGPYGPDHMRQVMRNWHTGFPDFKYHIDAIVAENNLVAVRTTFTGTQTGPFTFEGTYLDPSGRSLRAAEMFFFRVEGGKVVESWATWDRQSVLSQLVGTD
jgi:predicted ester cyclase